MLAEPEKLMYPYIESIRSVSHFSDRIVVNYAANVGDPNMRQFEESSYRRLLDLKEEVKNHCEIIIKMDLGWKLQILQKYEDWKHMFQKSIDECSEGWFMKFDADNIFYKNSASKIKSLFNDETDYLVFSRINMIDRKTFIMNNDCKDIYAVNISSLKKKNIAFEVGDISSWCVVNVKQKHTRRTINDPELVCINYDATFFTKERVVDFWRKTEDAYSTAQNRANRFLNESDDAVVSSFINYKKNRLGSLKKGNSPNFTHPQDITEKIRSLSEIHWGFDNFKMM
jgi:hypothetical protein